MLVYKVLSSSLPLMLGFSLITGCSLGAGGNEKTKETVKIRVMYDNEEIFSQQYGMLFSALHPEIEVEVVSTQNVMLAQGQSYRELMQDFIDKENPDVLLLDPLQYAEMSAEGQLMELETFAKRDKFEEDGLIPGFMDYFRQKGGGKLYGLSPKFYNTAIYYNKDLFDKYGISYPENKMDWGQLVQLASQFTTDGEKDKRVYGLSMDGGQESLFQLGDSIGRTLGLTYINPTTNEVTINTDSWIEVYNTALKAKQSEILYMEDAAGSGVSPTIEEFMLKDPFIAGKAAMKLDGSPLAIRIKLAQQMLKEQSVINWDVVTAPINPRDSEYGSFGFDIFAIHSNSAHAEAAWMFIEYIHSDEYARVTAKTQIGGGLPTRKDYIKDDQGHRFEAFYTLKPSLLESDTYKGFDKLPMDFLTQFDALAAEELEAAEEGRVSISEALESLQTRVQAVQKASGHAGES